VISTALLADIPSPVFWTFAVIFGLALGSFMTCAVYRIPRGISLWRRSVGTGAYRSLCRHCMSVLGARDLIPVLSWLLGGGRCRHCRQKIGLHYLLIEIATLLLVLGVAYSLRS